MVDYGTLITTAISRLPDKYYIYNLYNEFSFSFLFLLLVTLDVDAKSADSWYKAK